MSFDTEKHKIQKNWEGSQNNTFQIDSATLIQDKKKTQIKLSNSNLSVFNKQITLNSEWLPMEEKSMTSNLFANQSQSYSISMIIPEEYIPFARLNVAYRRIDGTDVFSSLAIIYEDVLQIINVAVKNEFGLPISNQSQNLKQVIWNVGFTQSGSALAQWYDFEIKFFFTLINPHYSTVS